MINTFSFNLLPVVCLICSAQILAPVPEKPIPHAVNCFSQMPEIIPEAGISYAPDFSIAIFPDNIIQANPMFYKFYRERTTVPADQSTGFRLARKFQKIYDQNGVKLVGEWINADDPYEHFFMTGFRDESHYQDFVEKVRSDKKYLKMTEELKKERESIEGVTLNASPDFPAVIVQSVKKDQPHLYKFYKQRTLTTANQPNSTQMFEEFQKFYDQNGVQVVGLWVNADDPNEQYFMTGYRDESHYRDFVEKVRSDKKYQEMSEEINKNRESIEAITLLPTFDK